MLKDRDLDMKPTSPLTDSKFKASCSSKDP
jgi:hypothetical protein